MISIGKCRLFALCSAALATMFFAMCGGSEGKTCGTAGCTSGAWMHIPLASSVANQANTTVTVCRNTECYTSALPAVPAVGGAGTDLVFAAATFVVGNLYQGTNQSIGLDLEWRVDAASQVQDGDRYVVTFTDATGATTTMLDKTATYQVLAPNGDTCAPVCSYTELTP